MKFNYKLRRVCGSYYGRPLESNHSIGGPVGTQWTGSNILYDEKDGSSSLISAVLNRVQIVDLKTVEVRTLPIETRSNITFLSLSPVAPLLVTVDTQNYVSLIHTTRGIVWHRWKLPSHVSCIPQFAPVSGKYLAFGVGSNVQVWCLPTESSPLREFAPLHLHRIYTGLTNDVTHIAWSLDESVLVASSTDGTLRLWTVNTVSNYQPITLSGHKTGLVGVYIGSPVKYAFPKPPPLDTLYSISADGTLVVWTCSYMEAEAIDLPPPFDEDDNNDYDDEAYSSSPIAPAKRQRLDQKILHLDSAHDLVRGQWQVSNRYYFQQEGGVTVISSSFCRSTYMFAIGFSSGVFGLYEMPNCVNIHTLSVGMNQSIQSCVLNSTGSWLAIGCPISQQLLVWEWQSETYILKQRGHAYGMRCMAYSPDSVCIATGGEDGKLKLWNTSTGFCYVTFPESTHTAAITGVAFANASVVITASLDGTVKAHDLHRYRTFRTLTSPSPLQFLSLAVDTAGELAVAGSSDPFHICVWNIQTGQLLDMLTGHAGPICDVQFLQGIGILVSASWDGTVKTWDLFKGSSGMSMESYQHATDVVCIAVSPIGRQICSGTMGGLLSFWNIEDHKLLYEIDGRRDIAGGRRQQDRMTSMHNANSRYFTSICYSADGMYLLAGGNSKYVCIYEISQQILVKKFQMSFNRSLDGVLDELNSKQLGDGGPINTGSSTDDTKDFTTYNALQLPGAQRGDDGSLLTKNKEIRTLQVVFSNTGREFSVVSGEGLLIYRLDHDFIFDPISMNEAITPASIEQKLSSKEYSMALRMALNLNEPHIIHTVLESVPYASIEFVCRSISFEKDHSLHQQPLETLLQSVAKMLDESPHFEFYIQWSLELLRIYGVDLDRQRNLFMRALRVLHKSVLSKRMDFNSFCNENKYVLDFVESHAILMQQEQLDVE